MGLFNRLSRYINGDTQLIVLDLKDLVTFLSQLPPATAVSIFFVTGSILALIRDWRVSIVTLLIQYLALGMTLIHLVRPEIAVAKVLVGVIICPMLYLSARQASWRRRLTRIHDQFRPVVGRRTLANDVFPSGRSFRLIAVLLLAVVTFSLARSYPLSVLPSVVSIAIYWLVLVGLFVLMLTEEPLKIGQGLLTALTGFELWYTTLEARLVLVGMWGAINLLLALVIGYLTVARAVNLEEDF